jgi:hypothetical protein
MKNRAHWDPVKASVVELASGVSFAGKVWTPTKSLAYVVAELCHSWPARNSKGFGMTAATLANSVSSAVFQLFDLEHRLAYYALTQASGPRGALGGRAEEAEDRIVGTIAAVEFPTKEQIAGAPEKSHALKVLVAVYRKAKGAQELLAEMARGDDWLTSMEWEHEIEEGVLAVEDRMIAWADAAPDLRQCYASTGIGPYQGKQATFLCGGLDGIINISGGGFTKYPADAAARVSHVAASRMMIVGGWREKTDWHQAVASRVSLEALDAVGEETQDRQTAAKAWDTEDAPDSLFAYVPAEAAGAKGKKSLRKFPLASVEKRGLDPAILRNALARLPQAKLPSSARAGVRAKIVRAINRWNAAHPKEKITVSEKASALVVGRTSAAEDGHAHDLLRDLTVLPEQGHVHWIRPIEWDPVEGTLAGVTSPYYEQPSLSRSAQDHLHTFVLSRLAARAATAAGAKEEGGKAMNKAKEFAARLKELVAQAGLDGEEAKPFLTVVQDLDKEAETEDAESLIAARIKAGDLVPKAAHETAVAEAKKVGRAEIEAEIKAKAEAGEKAKQALAARLEQIKAAKLDPAFQLRPDAKLQDVAASIPATPEGDKLFAERLEEWRSLAKTTGQASVTASAARTPGAGIPGDGEHAKVEEATLLAV